MNIADIKNWFEVAIPEPTIEQACIQVGCHYEKVAEMAVLIGGDDLQYPAEATAEDYKNCEDFALMGVGNLTHYPKDKTELLNSLCGQIVTAIGVAHMLGMDIEGALAEVNRSNHSKFEGNHAVFDENGKIRKGKNYVKPNLDKYI